jgi:hypothetical protein
MTEVPFEYLNPPPEPGVKTDWSLVAGPDGETVWRQKIHEDIANNIGEPTAMDWESFLETLAVNAGVGAIISAVKNPARAAALKQTLLHLADVIYAAYGIQTPPHQ